MEILLRVFTSILFMFCLYLCVAFRYEKDAREGDEKLRNKLAAWWIKIHDTKNYRLPWHTNYMREVAKLADSGLNRLFGEKLLSWHSVGTSLCFSLISYYGSYLASLFINSIWKPMGLNVRNTLINILFMVLLLVIGLRPVGNLKPWQLKLRVALLIAASLDIVYQTYGKVLQHDVVFYRSVAYTTVLFSGLLIGVMSDVLFIAITRKVLRWSANLESSAKITVILILNCVLSFMLIMGPLLITWKITNIKLRMVGGTHFYMVVDSERISEASSVDKQIKGVVFVASIIAAASNQITAFLSLIFFVLAFFLLAHRAFWPMLETPILALEEIGLIKYRFSILGISIMLLAYAWGFVGFVEVFKRIFK